MKHISTVIAVAFAALFGATAHEYVWPHQTLEIGEGGVIKNVKTVKWNNAVFYLKGSNASIENVSIDLNPIFYGVRVEAGADNSVSGLQMTEFGK